MQHSEVVAVEAEQTALAVRPASLVAIIDKVAASPDFDVAKLKELIELHERWSAAEAKKAFVEALSAFKAHAITILRDKVNGQYQSKYVSLGNLVATVTPFLSQHGLSCRWDLAQSAGIKITCIMTHVAGHSESVSMVCPPDTSGAKNPIQQIKSAITYGKVCTFESICGLASTDANLDDDGNSAGASNGDLDEQIEWLQNAKDLNELQKLFKQAYLKFEGNKNAQRSLIVVKDARKKELQ